MAALFIVLAFPLILFAGYGLAYTLCRGNARLLVGPIGFLLYVSLLTIPLVAVLASSDNLSEAVVWHTTTPAWVAAGLVAGVGLWGLQLVLPRHSPAGADSEESRVWIGPPGWIGFGVLMIPVAYIVVAEELVWRGYLLREIGLLFSAAAFALHHYFFGLRHVAFTFLAGLAWGGLFMAASELWPSIASHLAYNVLAWTHLRRARDGLRV